MQANSIFSYLELNEEINKYARIKHLKKDEVLMKPGDEIIFIPIVLKGSVRIIRQDDEGKETFLYHLLPGQTCAIAITCCEAGRKSMVKAIAEDNSEILQIPVSNIEQWYKYPEWKAFISNNYNSRFAELLQVVDLVTFKHMDEQLLHYLEQRAKAMNTRVLEITHQQIAHELNAHREAVSRLLRTMEQKGLVRLGRNIIEVLTL